MKCRMTLGMLLCDYLLTIETLHSLPYYFYLSTKIAANMTHEQASNKRQNWKVIWRIAFVDISKILISCLAGTVNPDRGIAALNARHFRRRNVAQKCMCGTILLSRAIGD